MLTMTVFKLLTARCSSYCRTHAGLEPYAAAGQDKGKISRSAFARMAQMAGTANSDAFGSDDDGNESASENHDAAA